MEGATGWDCQGKEREAGAEGAGTQGDSSREQQYRDSQQSNSSPTTTTQRGRPKILQCQDLAELQLNSPTQAPHNPPTVRKPRTLTVSTYMTKKGISDLQGAVVSGEI